MDNANSTPHRGDTRDGSVPPPDGPPASGAPGVSRAPLNLGRAAPAATPAPAPKAPAPVLRPVVPRPSVNLHAGERITGCRIFFTKLHPGAIHFLEEQITNWLKDNPQVVIKRTNVIQGEITEKKIEPNIVIVVWY
jgi:hypothetical protein